MLNKKILQETVKGLTLISQLGLSLVLPPVLLSWLGFYLKNRFLLGNWIILVLLLTGILTAFSSAKELYQKSIKKENKEKHVNYHRP